MASQEGQGEATLPVDVGHSEGKSLGFSPTAVAGPVDSPIGGLNHPVPVPVQGGQPVNASAPLAMAGSVSVAGAGSAEQ